MTSEPDAGTRYRQAIGRTIAAYRLLRGLSLRALADSSGISLAYLSELEHGHKEASGTVLKQLAEAYGITFPDLLRAIAERLDMDDAVPGLSLEGLEPDEIAELARFAEWLRWRRARE